MPRGVGIMTSEALALCNGGVHVLQFGFVQFVTTQTKLAASSFEREGSLGVRRLVTGLALSGTHGRMDR